MGHVHTYPQKPTSFYAARRLYTNVGFWLYRQNMLAFHFIDSKHVAIPVYTRLFTAILYKVGRKASSELYMGDCVISFVESCLGSFHFLGYVWLITWFQNSININQQAGNVSTKHPPVTDPQGVSFWRGVSPLGSHRNKSRRSAGEVRCTTGELEVIQLQSCDACLESLAQTIGSMEH